MAGSPLKGTKRSVVHERRAFLGVGAKDGRRIAIIPLVDREGEAVTRGELLEEVWGLRPETKTRVIDNFMIQGGDQDGSGSGPAPLGDFDDQFHVDLEMGALTAQEASDLERHIETI